MESRTVSVSAQDPLAAEAAYQCLVDFSEERRNPELQAAEAAETAGARAGPLDERELMVFDPNSFEPRFNLGPLVYESNTLTYR